MNGWVIYGEPDASWQELAAVMDSHPTPADRLQDNPGGVASFVPYLRTYEAVHTVAEELMVLTQGDFRPGEALPGHTIRRAIAEDLDALVEFYADAGSMARSRAAVERPLRDLRVWVATRDGAIYSAALTNAELATSAMVGGVFTEPGSRNRGLGRAVCSALCADLLHEGKQPVLYWQAPAAGAVYRKLGFPRRRRVAFDLAAPDRALIVQPNCAPYALLRSGIARKYRRLHQPVPQALRGPG